MELFLASNFAITLVALLYNRYSQVSISAKLTLSYFSLLCWVIPFTLIRDYLPQDVAVNIHWILPTTSNVNSITVVPIQPSLMSQLTLTHIFILASLIGVLLFITRIFKHNRWLNRLNKDPQKQLVCKHQQIPVYASNAIQNALLIGYNKPTIWINPKLIDSNYLDIVLAHETTHIKYKDNYSLAFMELIRAIYWWNPLLNILTSNIQDYIEARCDHKTSHLFTEGIYQQKLTDLILINLPVSNAGFVSAVISKNSNIRRLKSLKDKQNMNLFSKLFISLLLTSSIAILTFPVSTLNVLAIEKDTTNYKGDENINLDFESISINNLGKIIANYFGLEKTISDSIGSKLVSVKLKDIPENKILEVLSTTLNIQFYIQDGKLFISQLNQKTNPDDIGVLLDLNLQFYTFNDESKNTKEVETKMWSHFDRPMIMKLDNSWEVELIIRDRTKNQMLIEAKIYLITDSNTRELMSDPKVFTTNGNLSSIEIGQSVFEDGEQVSRTPEFRMEITPHKKKYSETNLPETAQAE